MPNENNIELSLESFNSKYKKYSTTFKNVYHILTTQNNLEAVNNDLRSLVLSSMIEEEQEYKNLAAEEEAQLKSSEDERKYPLDNIDKYLSNHELYNVHEFLVLVSLMARYKLSNIDIDRIKEKELGYAGCFNFLKDYQQVLNGIRSVNDEEILSELLSVGRTESYQDYIKNCDYCKDLHNVLDLLQESKARKFADSDDLIARILKVFNKTIDGALHVISNRYKYLMEGAFGVDKYVGVYTGKSVATIQGISNGHIKTIEPDDSFSEYFKPIFDKLLDIQLSTDVIQNSSIDTGRQFDLVTMVKVIGNNNYKDVKPIYYPYKVLEIIKKCGIESNKGLTFTRNTQLLNYRTLPENKIGGIAGYLKIISDYFRKDLSSYIYLCLFSYCQSNFKIAYPNIDKSTKDAESCITDILIKKQDSIQDNIGFKDIKNHVINCVNYFINCVTTAVILERLETNTKIIEESGEKILKIVDFKFKVCSKFKNDEFITTYSNKNFIYDWAELSEVPKDTISSFPSNTIKFDDLGVGTFDIEYTHAPDIVYARPMFAYKALKSLIEQQSSEEQGNVSPLSWNNILLGKNVNNKLITSGVDGDINLQENQVHWIFSGSRSGKGVMCYNIFSTAIASQVPVFYLDRKPDTATVLNELCPEMFIVNGGQYLPNIDYKHQFDPNNFTYKIPDYLKSYFTDEKTISDFVYFRAILLVLHMMVYAEEDKTNSKVALDIRNACKRGIILVLDEFSNYVHEFCMSGKFLSAGGGSSCFSKAWSQVGMVKELQSYRDNILKAKKGLRSANNKKDASEEDIVAAQQSLDAAQSTEFEVDKIYWAAIADAYNSFMTAYSTKKDSGGSITKIMQIFVLGQTFENIKPALSEGTAWYNLGQGTNTNKFKGSENINPLVYMLAHLNCDVITGYQSDRPEYLGQRHGESVKNGKVEKRGDYKTNTLLTESRRMFGYKSIGNLTQDEVDSIANTHEHFRGKKQEVEGYLNDWTYFKPFLILNNAVEVPECLQSMNCSPSDVERLGMRKGELAAPDGKFYTSSQYVGQCLNTCEKAGLTWDDLLNDNLADDSEEKHLNQGVGFEGYISQLAGGIPLDSMGISGRLADAFVKEVYGYTGTWMEFLCDFRPEWIISYTGIVDGKSVVQSKLADSFFYKGLISLGFQDLCSNLLGSLMPYYSGVTVSSSNLEDSLELANSVNDKDNFESEIEFEEDNALVKNDVAHLENTLEPDTDSVLSPNFTSDDESISNKSGFEALKQMYDEYDEEDSYDYDSDEEEEEEEEDIVNYTPNVDEEQIRKEAYQKGYDDAYVKVKKLIGSYVSLLIKLDPNTAHLQKEDEAYIRLYNMFTNMILGS